MDATTSVHQTLTCNIGDVTQPVDVTWKDNAGVDITDGQGGYTITKGTVDNHNNQASTLTIASDILRRLQIGLSLTWTCAAKSTLYPDSEKSTDSNVVVTFLTYGKFLEWIDFQSNEGIRCICS